MATTGKIGGILSLIAGALVLITVLLAFFGVRLPYNITFDPITNIINLIWAALAIVGGLLAYSGKRWGGILSLVVGVMMFLGLFLPMFINNPIILLLTPESFILGLIGVALGFLTIEAIICIVGGILGLIQ